MSRLHIIEIAAVGSLSSAFCPCGWQGSPFHDSRACAVEGRRHARDATRAELWDAPQPLTPLLAMATGAAG